LAGSLAVGLSVLAVPVFGPAFRTTPLAFNWLVPGLITLAGFKVLATFAIATGQTRPATIFAGIGVAANVTANVVLIPSFGSVGAAAASSISYSFISVLAIWWFLRTGQFRLEELVSLRGRTAAAPVR
jgi:O-antigen/teichoic acid export membrane protein